MCTDANPSKKPARGSSVLFGIFGLILSREANQSWGGSGAGGAAHGHRAGGCAGKESSQDPQLPSLHPPRAYGPDPVSLAIPCRAQGLADSQCSVDASWMRICCVHFTHPGAPTRLQVPLTLTVSACVSGGAVAVAGANVEMAVVPAAHATRVPGDLWSDRKETLSGSPLGRPGQCLPGC